MADKTDKTQGHALTCSQNVTDLYSGRKTVVVVVLLSYYNYYFL